jgi:hypothetical protein
MHCSRDVLAATRVAVPALRDRAAHQVRESTEVSPKTDAAVLRIYGAQGRRREDRKSTVGAMVGAVDRRRDTASLQAIGARIGALARLAWHAKEKGPALPTRQSSLRSSTSQT